jgi:hypothetical protein
MVPPYTKLRYARPYRNDMHGEIKYLEWSREGKVWSHEEVGELADAVMGELQEELTPFLTGCQVPYELRDLVLQHFS